jgi:hypothetical protein
VGVRHALLDVIPLRTSPPFRRLCIGQALSRLGGQMTLVAVMFQVWQMTDSTAWTGAVGLAQAIPLVVLGLFAGSVVDRVDRRKFYLITTSGQAVCSLLLAAQGFLRTLPDRGSAAVGRGSILLLRRQRPGVTHLHPAPSTQAATRSRTGSEPDLLPGRHADRTRTRRADRGQAGRWRAW